MSLRGEVQEMRIMEEIGSEAIFTIAWNVCTIVISGLTCNQFFLITFSFVHITLPTVSIDIVW